jgi:hypothetical protein
MVSDIAAYMNAARIGQMLCSSGIEGADAILYPAYCCRDLGSAWP